jgi:hypothetical protein
MDKEVMKLLRQSGMSEADARRMLDSEEMRRIKSQVLREAQDAATKALRDLDEKAAIVSSGNYQNVCTAAQAAHKRRIEVSLIMGGIPADVARMQVDNMRFEGC